MLKSLSVGVASALLLAACSNADQKAPTADAAPAALRPVEDLTIRTGGTCNGAFVAARPGLKILFQGPMGDRLWIEHQIISADGREARATSTMLIGPGRTRGPSHQILRRDGFVAVEGGTPDAKRRNVYGPELTTEAIQGLHPGASLNTTVTESSDFVGPAGRRDVQGNYVVTFIGCSDLDVDETKMPVKVFEVRSVARAYDEHAAAGSRDGVRETINRYWVSERLGWVLRTDDAKGSITAQSIEPAA